MSIPTRTELARSTAYLRRQLAGLRHEHEELLAAARAAVVAHYDGEALPLSVLIDTLDQLGQLPEYVPQLTAEGLSSVPADTDDAYGPAGNVLPLVGRRIA